MNLRQNHDNSSKKIPAAHSDPAKKSRGLALKPPVQRKPDETINGITISENDAVKQLSKGRVDLHASGASVKNVNSKDSRLTDVGARSMAVGGEALIGDSRNRGHEIWHLAQQQMGQVRPTTSVNGQAVNDDPALENEADVMGEKIIQGKWDRQSARTNQPQTTGEESSTTIQKSSDKKVIQRDIGFEMENKTVLIFRGKKDDSLIRGYKEAKKRGKPQLETFIDSNKDNFPPAKTQIIKEDNLSVETDDTNGVADLEFVIHGNTRDEGIKFSDFMKLKTALQKAKKYAEAIMGKKDVFNASELGNSGDFAFDSSNDAGRYVFHATAGVRMDKFHELFEKPGEKKSLIAVTYGINLEEVKKVIIGTEIDPPNDDHRNRLYNFAAMVCYNLSNIHHASADGLLKNAISIMPRTSLAGMFKKLPESNKALLLKHKNVWVDCITKITRITKDQPVVKNVSEKETSALGKVDVEKWLNGILEGTDEIADKLAESKSMGALKDTVDKGNPANKKHPKAQPIFEFRTIESYGIGISDFVTKPMQVAKTIAEINKEQMPEDTQD